MHFCRHVPGPPLGDYVDWFWYYDDWQADHSREHVLPDGSFELIINLEQRPRKLFDREDPTKFQAFRRSWLSGAQSGYLIIDVLCGASMIGAHFKPGGIAAFLEAPADELRDQVVELDGLWGASATELRERLLDASGPRAKFRVLEQFLFKQLAQAQIGSQTEKRVNLALKQFLEQPSVQKIGGVAGEFGVSHKHFIEEFRRRVGITPKLFCRIRRFQQVLSQVNSNGSVEWAALALDCGYFDQAHFVNDFKLFAGLNPTSYLRYRMPYPNFARAED